MKLVTTNELNLLTGLIFKPLFLYGKA